MRSFFKPSVLAAALLICGAARAQQPVVKAELDSMTIYVGGQVGLNVSVSAEKGQDCHILQLPDTLSSSVEVVEALKPDTIDRGSLIEYVQRYVVTSFDTGLQYVGPIPVVQMPDGSQVSTTDFALSVVNPYQEIKQGQDGVNLIFDIHDAEDAPFQWRELLLYWPWAVGVLVVAGLILLAVFLRRKYGRKGEAADSLPAVPSEPCEVTALRDLERIKTEKLWMRNQVKEYYTDLTETLRRYLASRYGIQAKESTSAEIMEQLKPIMADQPDEAGKLADILQQADLVKFAKMEPLPDENDKALADAEAFVNTTTDVAKRKEAEALANAKAQEQAPADVVLKETGKENA